MADLNDLIRSKKVKEFVRKEKSRPWTVSSSESEQIYKSKAPPITDVPEIKDDQLEDETAEPKNRNKLRPNVSQSEAKVEPQLRPNVSQSEAKVEPNLSHNKMKLEPQLRPKYEPKLSQSEAKVEPKIDLSALVGLQKNMLLSIYESCRFTGSKITSAIAIENLAHSAESTPAAARKAVQRLEEKGVLIRKEFKNGRGGWTKYELPDVVYQQVMFSQTEAKVEPNLGQTRAKLRPEVEPEVRPESSSSSSSLLNNKTTTTDPAWNEIDLSPLDGLIGFTRSHVEQIIRRNVLTPEQVQMSIYAFAFDLEENGKGKAINSPLNYFMGVLNKG
ncbi:MAG: hypothetical protein SGJ18_14865, partial [Pseudomonadota bacterium]|nr:hypothetical protein [Pseudomonadota bacterium]